MTTTTFTQHSSQSKNNRRRDSYMFSRNIYQIEVNGEDGDYISFEIMADTIAEATATAEQIAMESMVDITFVSVTLM